MGTALWSMLGRRLVPAAGTPSLTPSLHSTPSLTPVKKKESKLYGAHYRETDDTKKATKISFDSDDE